MQANTAARPVATVLAIIGVFFVSLAFMPPIGMAYFPRTDPGQFVINLKAATGTASGAHRQVEVKKVEDIVRDVVTPHDLRLIVSNIGATPGFSSIYTRNSGPHTAFVQVGLNDDHTVGSFEYMDRVRDGLHNELPRADAAYFQTGGLVDAILNLGLPAPIDIQVSGIESGRCLRHGVARSPGKLRASARRQRRARAAGRRLPRACNWTSTASARASLALTKKKSSATSSPR